MKRITSSVGSPKEPTVSETADGAAAVMSISQIQGLVQLLDRTDVSELELKRASEGMHLVLRKARAPDGSVSLQAAQITASTTSSNGVASAGDPANTTSQHTVVAPLVGVFHPWLKPRGGTLVAVGNRVKAGQLVGTIESLNVFNEIEATVAGRVIEIHVQDGQPVEYGQVLVTLDDSEVEGD